MQKNVQKQNNANDPT